MATHLEAIIQHTRLAVELRKSTADYGLLEAQAAAHAPRGFAAVLRRAAAHGPAIIAELKHASPSQGVIRVDYRPAEFAASYERAGAAAISVLTDEKFFQGSLADLAAVSAAVTIPVLRKDFILDTFQVLEARAAGADAVLLIVAAHADADLREFGAAARRLELDVLCEVHDAEELARAIGLGFEVIGVNCRDLKTLEVSTAKHAELAESLPARALRVAESGIRTAADIARLHDCGYDAFLVGESLMRHDDPGAGLALLTGRAYEAVA